MARETKVSKSLKKSARSASTLAVKQARANKVSYTVQSGKSIVQHRPDGTTKVVETLSKAYVKSSAKRYKVA